MTNENRDALLARIRAISARTTDNGCTEAEALAAASMLAKLLAEHGLSMTDVEIGEERCGIEYLETGRRALHESSFCMVPIAELCDCRVWTCWTRQDEEHLNGPRTKKIAYFGLPGDVETAVYLTRVVKASMDAELLAFMRRSAELGEPTGRRVNHTTHTHWQTLVEIALAFALAGTIAVAVFSLAEQALSTEPAPITMSEPPRLETLCLRAGGTPAVCSEFAGREI